MNQGHLKGLVCYDAETGIFTWAKARRGVRVGQRTGCINAIGYVFIGIDRKLYTAHRLAWFYMTGSWPKQTIDHINGNRADNRWSNLREATYSQNNINRARSCNTGNNSVGVSYRKDRRRWFAYLDLEGKRQHLGLYQTKAAAIEARRIAERAVFGEFQHQAIG